MVTQVLEKQHRPEKDSLLFIIVGAGLGGLGAAISLNLAGHRVLVLESASQIAEVGAGIQVLSNSTRVLTQWGLQDKLLKYATFPTDCVMRSWKGQQISSMSFVDATAEYESPFWDFHRADLHRALLERAQELGTEFRIKSKVVGIEYEASGPDTADVLIHTGERITADVVIGADGIFSTCRDLFLGEPSPPTATGDLAYRLLLNTKEIAKDPELAPLLEEPHQVNYWMGPGAHAVCYVLRGGELFNMVLLVLDDMPADATTLNGNVEEMRELYKDWDPRIPKLLALCQSVQKWKLCFRAGLESSWSHESGTFALLGDAVHATLPYLASGAGMSLEDGATLGFCFGKISARSRAEKKLALQIYEDSRRVRTESIVERGNMQQILYHLEDGPEQQARDHRYKTFAELERKIMASPETVDRTQLPDGLVPGDDPFAWRRNGVGSWLLRFDCLADVEKRWPKVDHSASQVRPQL